LLCLNALKRVQNTDDRPEQSDERGRRTNRGESRQPALHFGVDDGHRALKATLGGFDYVGIRHLLRGGLKFRKARRTTLAMWLFLLRSAMGDRFVEFAVLQGAGNLLHENARLLARGAVHQRAINHHAERVKWKE
jgi:hypothetical protein